MSVRRTIVFSDETDRALRAYLGQQGMQEGNISKFIEEAVAEGLVRRVLGEENVPEGEARALLEQAVKQMHDDGFERAVARIKARTADLSEDEVMTVVNEALEHAHQSVKAVLEQFCTGDGACRRGGVPCHRR